MIRFILSCLVALSVLGSAPAFASMVLPPAASQTSECAMPSDVPDQPADHGKMACCTSDCTMAGLAGMVPPASTDTDSLQPGKPLLAVAAVDELDSLDWATVDPPPRA